MMKLYQNKKGNQELTAVFFVAGMDDGAIKRVLSLSIRRPAE